ncbi:MAG: hypothetical protein PHD97_02020 [Bacteroidales bacterium]|nr:hypothetical protein [Bacteroidales bacterium]
MDFKNAVPFIKNLQTDKTVTVLQSIDIGSLFAYYYDKEIFKNYHFVTEELGNKNIILCNDSEVVRNFDFSTFNKIILSQTWENFCDPTGTLKTYMDKKFKLNKTFNNYEGIKIFVYSNPNAINLNLSIQQLAVLKMKKKIAYYENKIRSDATWLKQVKEKAEKNKISLDSMVYIDALYLIELEKNKK